jgi:hypothetical protein
MQLFLILAVLVACATVGYSKEQYTSTAVAAVDAARTLSLVSSIKGKKFDRFVSIWLENQDYTIAADDRMPPPIQNYPLIYIRSFTPIDRQPRQYLLGMGRLHLPDRQIRQNNRRSIRRCRGELERVSTRHAVFWLQGELGGLTEWREHVYSEAQVCITCTSSYLPSDGGLTVHL